jgi:hypothetical protein
MQITARQLRAMNLEVVKGFHGGIAVHCYKNRNCRFNSNEPQRDTSPGFTVEHAVEMFNPNPQSRPYLSTGLSASIAHYRYQAKYFNGQSDGKIEVTPREAKRFQVSTGARDNRVGIETYPSPSIDIDRKPNISPCFRESFLSASVILIDCAIPSRRHRRLFKAYESRGFIT